jgi:Endonuclease NucS
MRSQIRLWSVEEGKLVELNKGSFADGHKEEDLESWVDHNPAMLGRNLVIVGRQVSLPKVGFLDLLALDEDGHLVVIEFKRQQTTRDTIAQILDYASSLRLMTVEEVQALSNVDATKAKNIIDVDPVMIIVAAEVDQSVDRIVEYLASKAQLPLEVVTFTYATMPSGKEIIARSILTPDPVPGSTVSKNAAKVTLADLLAIAGERGVSEIVQSLHKVVALDWSPEMLHSSGGLIRYWVNLSSGGWRVIFGMYIGGEKYDSPNGQLDVWIRTEIVTEFTGIRAKEIKNQLKQFTIHHETETTMILRIGDADTSAKLLALLQQWDAEAASRDEQLKDHE